MFDRQITLVGGHFGSGKTEVCINGAITLGTQGERVALVDLDVVKPYFRTRSAREALIQAGVQLVAPEGENAYADLPILMPEVRALARREGLRVIMDVGGDDTGARVVGSLSDVLPPPGVDFYLVLNFRRPFTPDPDSALAMAREIEATARLRFTGIVSNTHLMGQTTPQIVHRGYVLSQEVGHRLGCPVIGVFAEDSIREQLSAEAYACPVLSLRRFIRPPFEGTLAQRRQGPLFAVGG